MPNTSAHQTDWAYALRESTVMWLMRDVTGREWQSGRQVSGD